MNTWEFYGRQRFADAVTSGESLIDAANEISKEYASPAGAAAHAAFISATLETLDHLRSRGFKFAGDDILTMPCRGAALAINGMIARREWDAISAKTGLLIAAVQACRQWLVVRAPEPPPPAPAPEPLPVRVVGLPERVTETEIKRDAKGNIAASIQIERDAP